MCSPKQVDLALVSEGRSLLNRGWAILGPCPLERGGGSGLVEDDWEPVLVGGGAATRGLGRGGRCRGRGGVWHFRDARHGWESVGLTVGREAGRVDVIAVRWSGTGSGQAGSGMVWASVSDSFPRALLPWCLMEVSFDAIPSLCFVAGGCRSLGAHLQASGSRDLRPL